MSKSERVVKDKEGRIICSDCERPISSLSHEFIEFDQWKWNSKTRKYKKQPTDSREQCICNHCRKPINYEICSNLSHQIMKGLSQKVGNIIHTIRRNKMDDPSTCKHIRIRFITESVKKIPEGYTKMQEKDDTDIERDYETVGYIVNKQICELCGKLLFTDEL